MSGEKMQKYFMENGRLTYGWWEKKSSWYLHH